MSPSLLGCQITVSDLKHVEVVVSEEVTVLKEKYTVVDNGHFKKSVCLVISYICGAISLLNPHE